MNLHRALGLIIAVAALHSEAAAEISCSREVLPILSDHCLACHGQDEGHRNAGLRLDTREGATAVNEGIAAIVPGKPSESELLTRICSEDSDELMPPPKSHKKKLTAEQIRTLTRWIPPPPASLSTGRRSAIQMPATKPAKTATADPLAPLSSPKSKAKGSAPANPLGTTNQKRQSKDSDSD